MNLAIFNFNKHDVRVALDANGEPLFCFPDVCKALDIRNAHTSRFSMNEKVSKDKGTFHSHGMHRRKREKHSNAVRIQTCKANLQLSFEGVHNES